MSESVVGSSLLLACVAAAAFLAAWWFSAITRTGVVALAAVVCLAATAASIFAVDVNIPLSTSHFRPSGDPAPVWVALLAWLFRLAPALVPLMLPIRRAKARQSGKAHG